MKKFKIRFLKISKKHLAQKYTAPYEHNMKYRFLSPKINQNLRRNTPLKRQRYKSETIPTRGSVG